MEKLKWYLPYLLDSKQAVIDEEKQFLNMREIIFDSIDREEHQL